MSNMTHVWVVLCKQYDCEGKHIQKQYIEIVAASEALAISHVEGLHTRESHLNWESFSTDCKKYCYVQGGLIEYVVEKSRFIYDSYKRPTEDSE